MIIKSPKKILAAPLDNGATSYHRIIQPLFELTQRGSPWTESIQFLATKEEQADQYDWANILFIQCLYTPSAFKYYTEQKKQGKFIVLDFDDDYINIPLDSPEQTEVIDTDTGEKFSFPPEMRSIYVQMFIQLADIVTVTNEHLRMLYTPWTKNIKVIPNCVSEGMRRDIPKKPNEKVKILWSGSVSHLHDLKLLVEPLQIINKKYGDKVEFHFQGGLNFQEIFGDLPLIAHPAVEFGEYLNKIQDINPDIALAPLRSDMFNMSKSNLKYCQMTLMEAAVIASNYGPYTFIDHEYDGMLAKNTDEWVSSLSNCIESETLRKKLTTNATKYVEINHMIEKQIHHWEEIFVR